MSENDRVLRYNVELTTDYFKRRLEDIHRGVQSFEQEMNKANSTANNFGKSADGMTRLGNAIKQVNTEAQRLNDGFVGGEKLTSHFKGMIDSATELRNMLRELNREKERILRGAPVNDENGKPKALETTLAQIKAVKDEIKGIDRIDLDKIMDKKAAAQLKEVTSAIKMQEKALASYDKSLERHKALSQSTFNKYKSQVNGANATLEKYGLETVANPYSDWSKYTQGIAQYNAQVTKLKENLKANREVINARNDAQAGTYGGNKEFTQAWDKVRSDAEKWNVALSRGKQITDEELRAAQRVTQEYRKQVEVLTQGDKHVLSNMPVSPVLNYDSAKDFNTASAAAKASSAIAGVNKATDEARGYEAELRRLQARCESLYATYRKNPTAENLQAFTQTRMALRQTTKEYERYQSVVNGASRTSAEFARKAMSHAQWIITGAGIAAMAAAPALAGAQMEDLDYRMAGIRQVIPQIEGIEDSKAYGDVATQIDNMNKAMDKFIGTATKYGVATDEVLDAAKSIGRMYGQGENGVTNTALFTDQAAKMAVADAFSMEEATKGLEAAMSQWNLQTEDTNELMTRSSEIIDIWTKVAHSGAASGQDISQAIQVAGASAAQAGISFGTFASLVEVGVRTTARSGNEIGQALKSMFVTLGSGKAEKALNMWGIKTKELGTDGKEHVRSLEKQILDISLAVSSTEKDTTKFLTTISGGKYQYSKIAAILKNYKEILRMQGILNDGDKGNSVVGFSDKQVEVQMDTIKRRMEAAKAEISGIIMDMGRDGGVESLKWLANSFRDIATGIRALNREAEQGGTNVLVIAKNLTKLLGILLSIKAASMAIGRAMQWKTEKATYFNAMGGMAGQRNPFSFSGMFDDYKEKGRLRGMERAANDLRAQDTVNAHKADTAATTENTVATNANTGAKNSNTQANNANTTSTGANTASKTANTSSEAQNTVATGANAGAKAKSTAANVANTASETANAAAHTRSAIAMNISAGASRAWAAAAGIATTAGRALMGVVGAFGGPIGAVCTLLGLASTATLLMADSEGAAANETKKHAEAMEDEISKMQQELDHISRRKEAAISVADAYNKLKESLAQCAEGSEEYKKKQEQLEDLSKTLQQITGEEAENFIENGQLKIDKIQEFMDKQKENTVNEKVQSVEQSKAILEKKNNNIEAIKAQIDAMKKEVEATKSVGKAYSWLDRVIAQHRLNAAQARVDELGTLQGQVDNYGAVKNMDEWINHPGDNLFRLFTFSDAKVNQMGGVDKVQALIDSQKEQAYDDLEAARINLAKYDPSRGEEIIDELTKQMEKESKEVEDMKGDIADKEAELELLKKNALAANDDTSDSRTPDTNNYGKERQNKGGHHKKPNADEVLTGENDLAIRYAANTDLAKSLGLDEATLRAIADRESNIRMVDGNGNLLEDYEGSGHFGMFQVTQADADRFGTGDISVPLNNALTAVKLMEEKMSFANGNLSTALKYYSGGDEGYADDIFRRKAEQESQYSFHSDKFGGYTSFNDDVLAAAQNELGQEYGGSSWRDELVKVCTTFIQRAMIDAGADVDTVDNLTANANNWADAAGGAFHSYAEIQNGTYKVKSGDIGLTNVDESGHAGHVIMIGKDGQGYYAAGGSAGVSAYYDTNWETAFGSSGIEGVISLNELTGKPYTQSIGGRVKKPKTIHDWQPNRYEEIMYQQRLAEEAATREELSGKYKDFFEGGTSGENAAKLAVAKLKLESAKLTKNLLDISQQSTANGIKNYLDSHKEIEAELQRKGKTWAELVPAEKRAMADLANDDSFKKLVDNEEKFRQKCEETTNEIQKQKMALAEAMGYMNPMARNKYMAQDIMEDYELNHPDGGSAFSKAKAYDAARPYYEDNVKLAKQNYAKARASSVQDTSDKLAEVEEAENELARLEAKLKSGEENGSSVDGLTTKVKEQKVTLARLKDELQSLTSVGNKAFQDAKKELKDAQKDLEEVDSKSDALKDSIHNMCVDINKKLEDGFVKAFSDVLTQGKSFKEAMKDLFNDIGKFALETLLRIGVQWAFTQMGLSGFSSGGGIPGRATGGNIPGYAAGGQPGGAIRGAGTGTSDDILAYVADKDRFVYLSNGEYVMTAEATRRIGKGNLDRMNYGHYADGGALSPTPYVPQLSPSVAKRARSIDRSNPNARMEELMQQQTDLLRGMGKDGGNGGLVILNTQASSQDVLKALQQNPRAVQAILGGQQRRGFR